MGDGKCFRRQGGEGMIWLSGRDKKWAHVAKAHVGTSIGQPPFWHGCCALNVKLSSAPDVVSHYLAQRCANIGGGLRRGLGSLWNESKC
jgi:hypothetical protein